MRSPFPGMDPYLEDPAFWRDFHLTFIGCWREAIADLLKKLVAGDKTSDKAPVSDDAAEDVKVTFTVPAYPQATFSGTVARLAYSVEPKTRTMSVELDVPNPRNQLAPGMFPEVNWPVRRGHPALFVPSTAVVTTTERTFVIRSNNGRAEWIDVRKGAASGDLVEILGQISAGDRVVRRWPVIAPLLASLGVSGCAPVYWLGVKLFYEKAPNPPSVQLDVSYDPAAPDDPKRQLDLYFPGGRDFPTVVFVHGGGWRGGDKHAPGDDLYENVALWAARQGMVAVNINYRLADYANNRNLHPTGEQDVAAAVDWVHAHVAHWGGNPQRIFLWGHSAGGSHVAGYASNPAIFGRDPLVKGIFLLSSPLDLTLDFDAGSPVPYYGATRELAAKNSPLATLKDSRVPVLLGYSSDETGLVPKHFERTRQVLCDAGHCPVTVVTVGSHQGEMQAVGTDDRHATDALLKFMESVR